MTPFEQAIQYIRDNRTWTDEEQEKIIDKIRTENCDLVAIAPDIHYFIYDTMERFLGDSWYDEVLGETYSVLIEV